MNRLVKLISISILFVIISQSVSGFEIKDVFKRKVDIRADCFYNRESSWFSRDRYLLFVDIWHEEGHAIKGKMIVSAAGDVFGLPNQDNGEQGDNYEESGVGIWESGERNSGRCVFYVNNPAVNDVIYDINGGRDLTRNGEINKMAKMLITIKFIPVDESAKDYKPTEIQLDISGGNIVTNK